jgi:hypothetical protein
MVRVGLLLRPLRTVRTFQDSHCKLSFVLGAKNRRAVSTALLLRFAQKMVSLSALLARP